MHGRGPLTVVMTRLVGGVCISMIGRKQLLQNDSWMFACNVAYMLCQCCTPTYMHVDIIFTVSHISSAQVYIFMFASFPQCIEQDFVLYDPQQVVSWTTCCSLAAHLLPICCPLAIWSMLPTCYMVHVHCGSWADILDHLCRELCHTAGQSRRVGEQL